MELAETQLISDFGTIFGSN